MNLSLQEKQRLREVSDRKEDLKNYLYRQGVSKAPDGRDIEKLSLFALEHVAITVKSNLAKVTKKQNE
ncbi:hypothetical protein [Halobacillus sp. BAB-2008]|uniref:hypothetical protein n=1 Tax=Halobacillus sp. BAB-2008 TaxID=1246484 RepID=UPI0002A4E8BD|nr:hypothetical protein [Halobacillus sp. BAB-2008]ELK47206.1 hypothetical protein D479_07132 [Halobacillus sp. BAB-2008]